jgi:uncharacterized SAM-binding protein YcdF (DUF218 family)
MFFILSKTIGFFGWATNFCLGVGLLGLLLLPTRFARAGGQLVAAGMLIFLLYGVGPIGMGVALMLEQRFPPWDASQGAPDGFIVVGGAVNPRNSAIHGTISLNAQAERLTVVADLARRYPNARIVFAGGNSNLTGPGEPEAKFVAPLWESFGIARERITVEDKSRNTEENAQFSKALVNPKPGERWLLITSALHMPRTVGVFRKAGFPVEAYPVDWRTTGWRDLITFPGASLAPRLETTDIAAHEFFGLVIYWLAGKTSAPFPRPLNRATAGPADKRP